MPAAHPVSSTIHLVPLDPHGKDREDLVEFLSTNTFPFHVTASMDADAAAKSADGDRWTSSETETFWVCAEDGQSGADRLGLVAFEDLEDDSPVFDLRLEESRRGQGWGVPVLQEVTRVAFARYPEIRRFEGQTREDNIAMRKVFLRCGFLKEAHYREGWPVEDGEPLASVAYAILRRDWETGTTTTFEWEDLR